MSESAFFEFAPATNRRVIAGQILYFGLWVAITAIAIYLKPAAEGHGTHQQLGFPPCPSVLLFNRPCPGCGLTTSFTRLLHGDIPGAFEAHALGPLLYLGFTVSAIAALLAFVRQAKLNPHTRNFQVVMVSFLVVFIGYGVVRFALTPHYQTEREKVMASYLNPRSSER